MATFLQLVERVKARLKDPEFDDDAIKSFLNDAHNEVLGENPYMFMERMDDFVDIPFGELDVPRDYQTTRRITAVRDHVGHAIEYLAPREYFAAQTEQRPNLNFRYTVYGNKIFYTVPRQEADCPAFKIRHFYLARPRELVADTDTPSIPNEFSEILVLGALRRAEETRDNYDFGGVHERHYEQLVENMKLRYGPRQQEGGNKARLPYGNKI